LRGKNHEFFTVIYTVKEENYFSRFFLLGKLTSLDISLTFIQIHFSKPLLSRVLSSHQEILKEMLLVNIGKKVLHLDLQRPFSKNFIFSSFKSTNDQYQ